MSVLLGHQQNEPNGDSRRLDMKLVSPELPHIVELMKWFTSEQEVAEWGGPGYRYPFDLASFQEDTKLDSLASFVLLSDEEELLAFGQCYQRLERCHLGRLAVAPEQRGNGLISILISRLCDFGTQQFAVNSCSLFVMRDNNAAINAYTKYGFTFADYPGENQLENCLYMVYQ